MYICNIKALVYINNDMFILKIYVYIYIHIIFTQMKLLPSNTGRCIYICMKQVKSGLKQVYIYIYVQHHTTFFLSRSALCQGLIHAPQKTKSIP